MTVARRELGHAARHARVQAEAGEAVRLIAEELGEREAAALPDKRLELLFVCAHPAIDPAARSPLMLQTVLGLDAARIASAFLQAPATMGQRLVRAKARIREAGLAFELPEAADLPARLDAVLEAIYAAYGSGWDDIAGSDPRRRGLAEEAIWLARLLAARLPDEPEALGLLALMLHCEARRDARRDAAGRFVPLAEQDARRWLAPIEVEAERTLERAVTFRRIGRFQLEAAIQSAHAQRPITGRMDWPSVLQLYEALAQLAPTVGALVGCAAAAGQAHGPVAGLDRLDALPATAVAAYQPYWALRAGLLVRAGRPAEAADACRRATGLTEDPAVRAFLAGRLAALA